MGKTFRAPRSDVDHTLDTANRAGQQYRAGDPAGAAKTLRHGVAETTVPELRGILRDVADAADLDIR